MGVSLCVVFRKINKMMRSGDKEWTEKLQPAVLAANTQTKRSTGYTPFYLMFGREFGSSELLNIVTSPTNPSLNAQPIIESAQNCLPLIQLQWTLMTLQTLTKNRIKIMNGKKLFTSCFT